MEEVYGDQPMSSPGILNYMEHRPLDGYVLAITPFNFASIAGNLPTAPALMGNTVVWKPASAAVLPAYFILKILEEAGMPPGVINMVPGPGPVVAPPALDDVRLGGIHFTGSTYVFSTIWLAIGKDIRKYVSADTEALVTALVRGAFEYQGQKCSAASRAYIPDSTWPEVKDLLISTIGEIKMGDICDFKNYMGAVIDKNSFDTISEYIEYAKNSPDMDIIAGGGCDESRTDRRGQQGPEVEAHGRRNLRTGPDDLCVSGGRIRPGAGPLRPDVAVRFDRGDICPGPRSDCQGNGYAAPRRRQFLRQ